MNQDSNVPVPKVAAVGIAGVIVTAVVTVLAQLGVLVPESVSTAATNAVIGLVIAVSAAQTVIQFLAGYFKKSNVKES